MTEQWIGTHEGTVREIEARGRQWLLLVGDEWFTTKSGSACNKLISCGLLGRWVRVSFENVKNPKDRRVHHIRTEMYPTIPGTEQGN